MIRLKEITQIIKDGIEDNRSASEIAVNIKAAIDDEWYYQRKDQCEYIIE